MEKYEGADAVVGWWQLVLIGVASSGMGVLVMRAAEFYFRLV